MLLVGGSVSFSLAIVVENVKLVQPKYSHKTDHWFYRKHIFKTLFRTHKCIESIVFFLCMGIFMLCIIAYSNLRINTVFCGWSRVFFLSE